MTNAYAGWHLLLREQPARVPPVSHPAPPVTPTRLYHPRSDRRHAFWVGSTEYVVGKYWTYLGLQAATEKPIGGVWTTLDIGDDYAHLPYYRDFYPVGDIVASPLSSAEGRLDSNGILHCVITFATYQDSFDYGEGLQTRHWFNACYYTFNTNTELWETRELVYTFPVIYAISFGYNCDPHPAISLDSNGTPFIVITWSQQFYHDYAYVYVFKRTGVNTWSQETAITKANARGSGVLDVIFHLPFTRVEVDHDSEDNLHIMAHAPHFASGIIFWGAEAQAWLVDFIYYNKRLPNGSYQGQSFITLQEWEGDPTHEGRDASRWYGICDGQCSADGTYHNVHVLHARTPTAHGGGGPVEFHIVHRWIDCYGNWNASETIITPDFSPSSGGVSSIALVPHGDGYKLRLIYTLSEVVAGISIVHRFYAEKIGTAGAWSTPLDIGSGPSSTFLYSSSVDWTAGTQLDLCSWGSYNSYRQYVSQYPP